MTKCTPDFYVTEFLVGLVIFFGMHAPPLAYVFVRWRQRFYLGLFPAAFSALSILPAFDAASECPLIQTESLSVFLAASCYFTSYLFLVFFKPSLRLYPIAREEHVPAVIAFPGFGALYAAGWLLLSLRRDRLLMDTGEPLTFKDRANETLMHGVVIAILAAAVALGARV